MRTRIAMVFLCALLVLGLASCSKKEESAQAPAASQPAAGQPAAAPAAGGQAAAPAPGTAPAATPAAEPAPVAQTTPPPPPPPPPPIVIPAGTNVVVRVGSTLSSKTAQDGQTFTGTLANGIAKGGKVIIKAGSGVTGVVSEEKIRRKV